MQDYTFHERVNTIFGLIFSSSYFLLLFVVLTIAAFVFILNNKLKNKIVKYLVLTSYLSIIILVITKYWKFIMSLNDDFIDKIFSIMYFPNIISYVCMLLISILIMIRTFIIKNYDKVLKIGNILCFTLMQFLFVVILEVVKTSNVDIYAVSSVYSNENLVILLQASSGVFFVWMGVLLFYVIVEKVAVNVEDKNDISVRTKAKQVNIKYKKGKDDVISSFSDEDFSKAYNGFQNKTSKAKYSEIFNQNNNNSDFL